MRFISLRLGCYWFDLLNIARQVCKQMYPMVINPANIQIIIIWKAQGVPQ